MKNEKRLAGYVLAGILIIWIIAASLPDYTVLWNI